MNFLKIFSDSFQDNWDYPAVTAVDTGLNLTYGNLGARMARVHSLMEEMGMTIGTRVAISGRNTIDWVTVYMSVITYGATAVVIPPNYTLDEVIAFAGMVDSQYLFIDRETWTPDADFQSAPTIKLVIAMDTNSILERFRGAPDDADGIIERLDISFSEKYPVGFQTNHAHSPVVPPDALTGIFFTAGTTGTPKAVMLSADSMEGNVIYGLKKGLHPCRSVALTAVPISNIWGCIFDVMVSLASGAHLYVFDRGTVKTDLIKALGVARPNKVLLSPRQVHGLLHRAERRVEHNAFWMAVGRLPLIRRLYNIVLKRTFDKIMGGRCEEIIMGGAAPSPHLEWSLIKARVRFCVGYGLAEMGGMISYTHASEWEPGTVGAIASQLMSSRIKPVDIPGVPEEAGELQIRGMTVMKGYYGEPDLTREVLDEKGWLSTGDLASVSPQGTITIYGRLDTMIETPGGLVFPEKLELMLITQPGIKSAVVVERDGRLTAIVEPDRAYMNRHNVADADILNMVNHAVREVNRLTRLHERIDDIEIATEPLLLTSKGTVRRYEYA